MCWPTAALCALLSACLCAAEGRQPLNTRPIIGVLAQENLPGDRDARGTSYIVASYIKFLEAAGSRVVPIRINRTEEEYTKTFNSINGLLLPGGDIDIETSLCSRAAKILYDLALKANDAGDYFPIWGTCQGFQQLSLFTANKNLLTLTDTLKVALPLTLTPAARSSRLFRSFPEDVMKALTEENITSNFHKWSLSIQNFSQNAKLRRFYKVLSTNNDGKQEFISTMEAYHYPFYAVQWHPEKNPFEWTQRPGAVHSITAVRASFYTESFFVSEARKNQHHFLSPIEEKQALIYNFSPIFHRGRAKFMQSYYFD
ncbi:zgc:171566 [Clinocottus analis]|uniref:zgc:171566 n=1 Tax=Clinocottus analis TaxID=304258 RepID=UPI0035C1058F